MGQALLRQRRTCRAVVWAFLLVVLGATSAYAQFDRGTISGTIKDAQGGVVPGVTVTITSTATQQTRTTVTDGSGFYTSRTFSPADTTSPPSSRDSRKPAAPASRSTRPPR